MLNATRWSVFIGCLMILFLATTAHAAGTAVITVGNEAGQVGATVTVPLTLKTNSTSISTMLFTLTFDTSRLTFVRAEAGAAATAANKSVQAGSPKNGGVKIVIAGGTGALSDGVIVNAIFTVSSGALNDVIALALTDLSASQGDTSATTVAVTGANGSITIGDTPATTTQGCFLTGSLDNTSLPSGKNNPFNGLPAILLIGCLLMTQYVKSHSPRLRTTKKD